MYPAKLGVVLIVAFASFYQNCEARTVKVSTDKATLSYVQGQSVQIQCLSTATSSPPPSSLDIEYLASGAFIPVVSSGRVTVTSKTEGLTMTTTASFSSVEISDIHEGYTCVSENSRTFFEMFVLPLASVPSVNFTKNTIGSDTTMQCNTSTAVAAIMPNPQLTLQWSFSKVTQDNGVDVSQKATTTSVSVGSKRSVSSTLAIKIDQDTAGYYHCNIMLVPTAKSGSYNYTRNATIDLKASVAPGVAAKQKIKVFQKKDTKLICKVSAFPLATVTWKKNNEPITAASNIRYKFSDDAGTKNAVFEISSTEYSDRAVYECVASNQVSSATMEFTLRVKDPLGALWPFIGIVIEAIVLAIIILAYEKYRGGKGKKGHKGECNSGDENRKKRKKRKRLPCVDINKETNRPSDAVTETGTEKTVLRLTEDDTEDDTEIETDENQVTHKIDMPDKATIIQPENMTCYDTETPGDKGQRLQPGKRLDESDGRRSDDIEQIFIQKPSDTAGDSTAKETIQDLNYDKNKDTEELVDNDDDNGKEIFETQL